MNLIQLGFSDLVIYKLNQKQNKVHWMSSSRLSSLQNDTRFEELDLDISSNYFTYILLKVARNGIISGACACHVLENFSIGYFFHAFTANNFNATCRITVTTWTLYYGNNPLCNKIQLYTLWEIHFFEISDTKYEVIQ